MSSQRYSLALDSLPTSSQPNANYYCLQIRILQQMTVWVMRNPEKVREKMEEGKDSEQTQWVRGC